MLVIGDDATRPYGHTNPIFTAVITGLLPGDNITPVFYTVATSASPLGRYDIEIYLDDPDGKLGYYDVIMWGGRLTVAPAVLTGTIASQSRSYGQTNSPFTVAYTGFVNGQNSNILHGPLAVGLRQRYQRRLSLLKFMRYLSGGQENFLRALRALLNGAAPLHTFYKALVRYCCYDKRKRQNYCDVWEALA